MDDDLIYDADENDDILVDELSEHGRRAKITSWMMEDRDEILVVAEWDNGEMTSYIEPLDKSDDEDVYR